MISTAAGIGLIVAAAVLSSLAAWHAIKNGQTGPQFGLSFKTVPVRSKRR